MSASEANGKPRRRIVHVTLGLDTGGQEKLLVEMARHADRTRFDLHFVSLSTRGPMAEAIAAYGWPITALEEPDGLRPRLVWRLISIFRRLQADVVHTHDEKPLLYGALAARLAGVPRVIHTQHHGRLAHITRRQTYLVRLASRLTHRFVCVSADSAQHALESGVARDKIAVLHNTIDLDRFAYRGPAADGPAVTVARLHPLKGIDVLLRAAAQVVRVDSSFRLEIAGAGPCGQGLQKLAAELGLEEQVRFLGEVRDIPALLSRARLFVLPSFSEGVSLTLLEAMATGLPVLATRVGGNPEVVVPGETGELVPARDPAALAHGLLQLWRDEGLGRHLGEAGRRRVEERFDVRRMMARYESLYENPGADMRFERSEGCCEYETQASAELLRCS